MGASLITTGGGLSNSELEKTTATEADVLTGKTFYSGNKELKTGTMALMRVIKIADGLNISSVDVSKIYDGFATLTVNNFLIDVYYSVGGNSNIYNFGSGGTPLVQIYDKSPLVNISGYDSETGILSLSIAAQSGRYMGQYGQVNTFVTGGGYYFRVYLITGEIETVTT